jgi:hypothetical protein
MKIKFLGLLFGSFFFSATLQAQHGEVHLGSKQQLSLFFHRDTTYVVHLKNKAKSAVNVRVMHRLSGAFVRGFGLTAKGKATVTVEAQEELLLENTAIQQATVQYTLEKSKLINDAAVARIRFQLYNSSETAIPLWIPGVMNPNLSPNSKSTVTLKIGQVVYYKSKGRKQVLFEVDDRIAPNAVIDVAALIQKLQQ